MHIKQVIICGFRSYKDQIVVEPFSPQHNIVIGRNGTGKSNFFDAIRFGLLTSQFANLRQDERQALLHEGSGKHVMSAYVEIIFDNRDGRFPVDTEDVTLRRTIGVKKDEFFLNKKHIPKNDVIHLLESAGFSRSNPYYIVQQGKVNALALMKDKDRLVLLKEVAGTRVYEERRVESLKIMHETASRREKIQEVIQYIEERLNELEAEKEELKEYQALDKQKRALEYSMHDKTLQSVTQELDHVEKERVMEASNSDDLHEQSQQVERDLEQMKVMTSSKNQLLSDLLNRQKVAEFERTELIQQRYQLELQVKEMEDQVRADTEKQDQVQRESSAIADQIQTIQRQLQDQILPEFDRAQATEKQLEQQWKQAKHESEALIAKQSHMSQFQNKAERDAFLNEELAQVAELCAQKRGEEKDLQTSMKELEHQLAQDTAREVEFHEELEERRLDIESYGEKLTVLKQKRNQIAEERKDKWRAEHELGQEAEQVAQRLHRAEDLCFGTMPQDIRKGLQFIQEQFGSSSSSSRSDQNGIYGPVIELFQPQDDRFCTALDEAAGNTLFHVVVETDEIAAKLMRELDRKKAGRVTFLPLNRLSSKKNKDSSFNNSHAPRNDDAMPLLDKISFDSQVAPAMDVVFGKKLLCRDLATCAQYAESSAMDCLTLDGDQVHRRGGLAGGYRDPNRSRVRAHQERQVVKDEHIRIQQALHKIKSAAEVADQHVSQILGEIQKLEWEKNQQLDMYEQLQRDSRKHVERQTQVRSNILTKTQLIRQVQETLTDFETKHHDLEQDIQSTFHSEDDAADQEQNKTQLRYWTQQVDELAKARQRHENQVLDDIRTQKHQLESTLNQDLLRRQQEMKESLVDPGNQLKVSERAQTLIQHQVDYDQVSVQVEALTIRVSQLVSQTTDIQEDLSTFELQSQDLHSRQVQLRQACSEESQRVEKCLGQRRRLLDKRQDAMQQLRECGSLSLMEVEKYAPLNLKHVMKKLHQVQDRLKKYEHVNKKALDQYVSFHDQRTELLERETELLDGSDSIQDLIQVLDQRKDEAILRTFKGVSHHFTQVFRELVPTGEGRMLIVRNTENDEEETKHHDPPTSTTNVLETFTGIQIKVNFRGEGDSTLMSQLSGGQKALVALAFIFAIQRCDPAPFYLFDEIDQALDSTHRAAVAALIHRQAHASSSDEHNGEYSGAQFITSTFRPEMVQVADQFYGIGHQNKISNVHSMTQDESLEFIANIMAEEEGTTTTNAVTVGLSQSRRKRGATKSRKLDEQDDETTRAETAP